MSGDDDIPVEVSHRQLRQSALRLPLGVTLRFDNFYAGPNQLLVQQLQQLPEQLAQTSVPPQIAFSGRAGSGKTHLLNAVRDHAEALGLRANYVPLQEFVDGDESVFAGLEHGSLIAVDDLQGIETSDALQTAIFALINTCRREHIALAMASSKAIGALARSRAEVSSRLQWGQVHEIRALDDGQLVAALAMMISTVGLTPSSAVINYLLARQSRNLGDLAVLVRTLERQSLSSQRRLTVPFVRQVLEQGSD